jgi:hypothetical protein
MISKQERSQWRLTLSQWATSPHVLSELATTAVPKLLDELRRLEELIDNSEGADIDAFFREVRDGRVDDCGSIRCHSTMSSGPFCIRHELAFAQYEAAEEKKWARRYEHLWQECKDREE